MSGIGPAAARRAEDSRASAHPTPRSCNRRWLCTSHPESGTEAENGIRVPGHKLALVLATHDSKVRLVRKNDVLREVVVPARTTLLPTAWYLPDQGSVLFTWHIDEPVGCDCEEPIAGFELYRSEPTGQVEMSSPRRPTPTQERDQPRWRIASS